MSRLDFADLADRAADYDEHVARTVEIDHFCSCADWILPAHAAFAPPEAEPFIWAGADGYVAMMVIPFQQDQRIAVPLEASWGLAAPMVGRDPRPVVERLFRMMLVGPRPPGGLFLSGLQRNGLWVQQVLRQFRGWRIGLGPTCGRRVASLEGGVDGFLGRRSAKFRAGLRRARRRAEELGFEYEWHAGALGPAAAEALFQRILAIETRSWKGREGVGFDDGAAERFYRLMISRMAHDGRLRALFVTREGADIAFVFGGVFGDTYRGLQVSFDDAFREHAPGNLAHLEMIRRLCDEGVRSYDLGTDMPYKQRWGEPGLETITLAVLSDETAASMWR